MIGVGAKDRIQAASEEVTGVLLQRHKIANPNAADFQVRTQADLISTRTEATRVFTILLAAVAAISLVVGGIGIMNIMLVSVTQRTREIGIRLAVGATEWDVQVQFLSEAVALSVIGGLLGLMVGVLASVGVQNLFHFPTKITPQVFAIGGFFSAGIGVLFGYYPARKASQLDPIQGLRYE